jgi:hypothetical protein
MSRLPLEMVDRVSSPKQCLNKKQVDEYCPKSLYLYGIIYHKEQKKEGLFQSLI